MDNVIDLSIPVAEVIEKHPEVLDVLVELGFTPLANPVMHVIQSGAWFPIKKALVWTALTWIKSSKSLELNGYEVVGI